MKNVRSSLPCISMNFVLNSVKCKFFPVSIVKHLRLNHPRNLIIGHLNIYSIRNKFDLLKKMFTKDINILMITETKLDDSLPASQFLIQRFCTPFRLDRNKNGSGIPLYIRSNITSTKLNKYILKNQIEVLFVGIRIRNSIWLLCCSYNPNKLLIASHIQKISNGINAYCNKYENILIMSDFSVGIKEVSLHLFCNQCKLKSMKKDPTCYKNIDNPSCIDLLLTNSGVASTFG